MKTKKKSKKMVGRSALMASLIVAAITGVTPAFAADNLTDSKAGKIVNTDGTYIAAKSVTLTGVATGKTVSLAVVSGGKLYVGKGFNATPGAADSGVFNNPNTTLTTDNMTIEAGGNVEVSNNSTLKIVQNKALVEGTLTLNDGTVDIANGTGTLQVAGGTGLLQTVADSDNTVKGSVLLGAAEGYAGTGNGKLTVAANSTLSITKDLTVKSGSFADVNGTLNVGGATTSEIDGGANTGILLADTGKLVINNSSAVTKVTANDKGVATGVDTANIALKKVGTKSDGTLILRVDDKNFKYTDAYLAALAEQLGMKGKGNVGILGGTWTDTAGGAVVVENNGNTDVTAPSNSVNVKADTITAGTAIMAKGIETGGAGTTLTNAGNLTLVGGTDGGNLVTGAAIKPITNSGTLTLGILDEKTSGTLNTTVTNTTGGKLNVEGGSFVINKVVNTDGTISVTNSSTVITELTATKGTLFVDPAFVGIGAVTDNKLGTTILAGAGGNIAIGGNEAWLNTAMAKAGVNPLDPKTSVLGVRATQTLQTGTFVVLDPTLVAGGTPTGAAVQLGANSLFVADMKALTNGTALILNGAAGTNAGTVKIDPTAKLYLDKLTYANNKDILFADNTPGGGKSATMDGKFGSILNPDIMLNASFDTAGSSELTVTINKASKVMNNMSSDMDGLMTEVWINSRNSVNSLNAGTKLVSRAANSDYMTPTEGARVVEGAARMAVVGATQQMAFAASNAATSAATQRTSMANPMANSSGTLTALVREEGSQQWKAENTGLSAGNGLKNGAALWIMPLYQNMNAWNMKADNFNTGYSANFGGVALGGDYTFADAFRVGLALNIGGGFAESNGDFAKTENNFNFWGINLYGGWAQNNFAVTADVGYTSTFNDVKQDTPLNLGMSEFKTDMYSYAITAGLRGEYKVQTEYVDIIPHIAARYTNLHSDDYKIKSGGETVFKGEAIDQSIWTFPIGVAFSKDVDMSNGWTFKPQLDLAVIPAAGDIAAKSKVKIPGNSVTADLESNIIDGISYQGALGFDMYKDNIAFGINYTIQASEHTTGHGVQATVRYEF